MTRRAVIALPLAAFFVTVVLVITGTWYAVYQVGASNRRWCATITLLTAKPVPYPKDAKTNPSRLATYELYEDFVRLRDEFGC